MTPLIYYDQAEERSGIPAALASYGCNAQRANLQAGDYLLSAALAVERKSPTDLVDSLRSGKLYRQLETLDCYEHGILLIEGDEWRGNSRLKLPMLGQLYHWLSFRPALTCIYAPTSRHSAKLLADIASREQSGKPGIAPTPPEYARRIRTPAEVLQGLPGVGPGGALRLLERFGSVRGVLLANEAEIVEAIGPKRGAALHRLVNAPGR